MRLNKTYKYLIWDFDGTINDTSPGIYATFTTVLKHFGVDARGMDLSEHIGPPLTYSYTKLLGEKLCDEAIALHCKVFADTNAAQNSRLYDGIVDVLNKIKQTGRYMMAIASSKYQPHAEESLAYHRISQYFACVYGQTESRGYKSEVIRQLIADNGWNKADCLMIGDTLHDVNGANDNGVDVVGVTYGFGKREDLQKSRVVALADSPDEILELLNLQ